MVFTVFLCVEMCMEMEMNKENIMLEIFFVYTHINGFVFSGDICSFYQGKKRH